MDNKYFKILQELKPEGVGVYKNISPVLLQFYPGVSRMDSFSVREASSQIYRLLEEMKKDELIALEQYTSLGSGNDTNGYTWLDQIQIKASIKQHGIDILEKELNKGTEQRLQESIIETNQSIRDANSATITNSKYQKKFGNRSLLLGGISAAFILVSIIQSALYTTPQRLKEIELQAKKTDTTLKHIQFYLEEINSSIKKAKTDTVFLKQK